MTQDSKREVVIQVAVACIAVVALHLLLSCR